VTDQNGTHYTYDVANRMVSAGVAGGTEYYQYTADNKRVVTYAANGTSTVVIYGAFGEKLATVNGGVYNNVYFAGRLIARDALAGQPLDSYFVAVDRLGSVRTTASYLPYGEEISATANGTVKFATYTRDASTGLDYADQRFYSSTYGRFLSADRFQRAAKVWDSMSWNKYSYVQNDPVNKFDPTGREYCDPDDADDPCYCDGTGYYYCYGEGGGGGNGGTGASGGAAAAKQKSTTVAICQGIPDGQILGASGSIGVLGGETGSIELLINYSNGKISAFVSAGLQLASGSGASVGVISGAVFGLGSSNQNYSGPFSTVTVGIGPYIEFVSATSGGFGSPLNLIMPFVVGGGVSLSLLPSSLVTVSGTTYSAPLNIGNLNNPLWAAVFPLDAAFAYARKAFCQ